MTTSLCSDRYRRDWRMTRDAEGHREYKLKSLVAADASDGPANVLSTAGLPLPGSLWLVDGDADVWAWCRLDATVTPVDPEGEPTTLWIVEQTFSTKPLQRCSDAQFDNPLLEPQKLSGGFNRASEEAAYNRDGRPITSSSWELFRGQQVEFDRSRPTVKVEQNVPYLGIELFAPMQDTVNAYPLWGLPPRTIKLSEVSWERKYYGLCNVYYTRQFSFEIRAETWDRVLLDEGSKALNGHWDPNTGLWTLDDIAGATPDPLNPAHFKRFKDRQGENTRAVLDGAGQPFNPELNTVIGGCTQCPRGAPQFWRLTGFSTTLVMEYVTACTWEVTSDGTVYTLEYEPINGDWILSGSTLTSRWRRSGLSWRCLGPNVMRKDDPNPDLDIETVPAFVTLTAGHTPGAVAASVYPESDFLLLGIPLLLR